MDRQTANIFIECGVQFRSDKMVNQVNYIEMIQSILSMVGPPLYYTQLIPSHHAVDAPKKDHIIL